MQSMVRRTSIIIALLAIGIFIGYFFFFKKEIWTDRELSPPLYPTALEKFSQGDVSKGLDILKSLRRRYHSPIWEKRWHFLSGYWHLQSEQANQALIHFQKSYTEEDPLYVLSLYYGALSALKAKKTRTAIDQCTILLNKSHPHPYLVESIYLLSDALIQSRDFERARTILIQHRKQLEQDSRSEFLFKLASIDLKEGKKDKALSRFKKIYCLYPFSPESSQLEKEIGPGGSEAIWKRSEIPLLLQRGEILESNRKFSEALRFYQSLLLLFPEYAIQPEFLLRLGRTYYGVGEIDKALDHLNRLKSAGKLMAEAKYFLSKISLHRGRIRAFKREMEILASSKERTEIKAKSLISLAEYYDNRGKWSLALPYYEKYLDSYPLGEKTGKALWRTGLLHYLLRDFRDALSIFSKILNEKGNPYREPATFWAAKCHEKLKNKKKALELYRALMKNSPFIYYGIEAEERSLKLSRRQQRPRFMAEGKSHNTLMIPIALSQDFAASRELILLDLKEIAMQLLENACLRKSQHRIDPFLKASELALEWKDSERAATFVQKGLIHSQTPLTEIPLLFLKLIYPKKESLNICQVANRFSLDCHLVHAIILQESGFNASAVSRSGAIGLMQIMPETGGDIAMRMRKGSHSDSKLYDPKYNMYLGCSHFSRILDQFNGSLELSLAAYNAGEANAKKWRKWLRGYGIEEYVDNIPYFETRNYIKKIKSHYKIYSELYGR